MFSEVWERAEMKIKQEIAEQKADHKIERWIASSELIRYLRSGLKNCPAEVKTKIVYGFEQILPQVSYT